jgi:F-type H+-transporting ATPase subunit beta
VIIIVEIMFTTLMTTVKNGPDNEAGFASWLQGVLGGKYDGLPEQSCYYMVGGIEEVIAKAEKTAKESAL